jgi:DNA-directed RNA polymerase I subunit RPA2
MAKQTMGTPAHAFPYRTDNKLYRLLFPQSPVVRPSLYQQYGLDLYPNGANAIVAVLAYTGYDMEDAMILCRGAAERGFGHACIYKTETIDLSTLRERGEPVRHRFGLSDRRAADGKLDVDGLPPVGTRLVEGDPLYAVMNETTHVAKIERYKGTDPAYVEEVRLLGTGTLSVDAYT